jgi:PAS domain S-box-containing protein
VQGSNQLNNPLIKALIVNCRDISGRKKAEQAISESYKKLEDYKFALDQSSMIFITNARGAITHVNENLCRVTKYSYNELVGNSPAVLDSGYHPKEFFDYLWHTVRSGKVWRAQMKCRSKDGTFFWVDSTIIPFLDASGKPYQFLSIDADITKTKSAEEALRVSNERFQYVTQATFDAIWDWDIVNSRIFWGDGYKTLFGYEPGTYILGPNERLSAQIHPGDRELIIRKIDDTINGSGAYWSQGYRFRKANGEYASVIDKGVIIRDEAGNAIRMIGAMQDITERVKALEELEKSELKFRSMVHNINDVITLVDENGFVMYSSPSLRSVLGYEPEEVNGLKIFALLHPDDYARSKEVFKNVLSTKGNSGIIEFRYRHKDGHYLLMESQGNNQLHNPAISALIITTRDITRRKEKEEETRLLVYELMEKNADLKQFTYITSHNLRAPLTNLMAICNLLDTAGIPQHDTMQLINAFKTSTAKLDETLNDLIKILIIKDGRNQEIEPVYFDTILDDVKGTVKGALEQSGAVIHADFSAAPSVGFYRIYMESILFNLITNAVKYAHPGRKPVIDIKTQQDEQFVTLTIKDNGTGMNMARVKNKIFGLYQRFHSSIEGKGTGLYIVHSQVTALGGTITVNSTENVGTTFTIHFKTSLR